MSEAVLDCLKVACYRYNSDTVITKVLTYLFTNMSDSGLVAVTQRDLAKQLNVSVPTVSKVLSYLQAEESPIICMVQQGLYKVNLNLQYD